jgi:hypothetical protein
MMKRKRKKEKKKKKKKRKRKNQNDGGTIALPIFFNGEAPTASQLETANNEIQKIIDEWKSKLDLTPYYWSKQKRGYTNKDICKVPKYADISGATFKGIPAALSSKVVFEHYNELAKEYFLNG